MSSAQAQWQDGRDLLLRVLKSITRKAKLTEIELRQFEGVSVWAASDKIRKEGDRRIEWRKRLALAQTAVERAASPRDFSLAVDAAAFTFFRLQLLRPGFGQGQAMAWAELCLFLGDLTNTGRKSKWLVQVQNFHRRCVSKGLVPAFGEVGDLSSEEIRSCLDTVRAAMGSGPYVLGGTPSRPARKRVASEGAVPLAVGTDYAERRAESQIRIRSVSILGFRGIPGPMKVDFSSESGDLPSILLTGDNGVGKSSIVSAIEFACQARIGRREEYNSSAAPRSLNYSNGSRVAQVGVELSDGKVVRRTLRWREDKVVQEGDPPRPDFAVAPVTIQRSDIVSFLATSPAERGLMFVDHFQAEGAERQPPVDSEIGRVRHELQALRVERKSIVDAITERTGVDRGNYNFVEFVNAAYFEGLSKKQYEDRFGRTAPSEGVEYANRINKLGGEIGEKKRELDSLQPAKVEGKYARQVRTVASLLGEISTALTAAFHAVTGTAWVRSITVRFAESSALSIDLGIELANGEVVPPEQIFSEGYQDLVALLFFVEVSRAAANAGQAKVVILDDVFQSVDAGVRLAALDYVLRTLRGWQLFVTVHDNLWKAQATDLARRHNFPFGEVNIRRWDFATGPVVIGDSVDQHEVLSAALRSGSVSTICAEAGRFLEQISDKLSYCLPISVTRRAGDRYTLADLWPGVAKKLRKSSAQEPIAEIDRLLHLRNLVGAHYNEWAEALPVSEADAFGRAVIDLFGKVFCQTCRRWVRESPVTGVWICRCGATEVRSK